VTVVKWHLLYPLLPTDLRKAYFSYYSEIYKYFGQRLRIHKHPYPVAHNISQFLPKGFHPDDGICLIAGKERYPELIAERMTQGIRTALVAYEGETLDTLYNAYPSTDRIRIKVGKLGKMLKTIRSYDVKWALMAGQITPGRLFKGLHPDLKAITLLAKLKEKNAETIFTAISDEISKVGVELIDARAFLDDQMASEGPMTPIKDRVRPQFIEHGIEIAKEIARLDIGQGVVIRKGTVVAVEAFEGTDRMLERAGSFDTNQLVFIKTVKPKQDYRFDVPVFGLRTLEVMKRSGISHAYLEAGKTIILEKESVLTQACDWGIQLVGY
jgi:UDP-2,3-diacylglucosamine hydrolase